MRAKALFDKYTKNFELNSEVANILAHDGHLSSFYEEALLEPNSPISLANIVVNEVARELKRKRVKRTKIYSKTNSQAC